MTNAGSEVANVIAGRTVQAADGQRSELLDPTTGEVFGTAPSSGRADVEAACAAAADAQLAWRRTTPGQRQAALLKLADLVESHLDDLVDAECQNTGKIRHLTRSEEFVVGVDQLRFFAGAARVLEGRAAGSTSRASRRTSPASRSGWSGRSHRGTTRS